MIVFVTGVSEGLIDAGMSRLYERQTSHSVADAYRIGGVKKKKTRSVQQGK